MKMKPRKRVFLCLATAGVALTGLGANATAEVLTFQQGDGGAFSDTAATWIQERSGADDNFGSDVFMIIEEEYRDTSHLLFQGLVGFFDAVGGASGQVPLGATINSATLTMWSTSLSNSGGGAATLGVHQMLKAWVEDEATWTLLQTGSSFGNGPFSRTRGPALNPGGGEPGVDYAATALDAQTVSDGDGVPTDWDVTSAVQNWADGSLNAGFYLLFQSLNGITLQSDDVDTPATRPLLTVDFSTGAPSGDLKLSVTTDGSSLTFMWNSTTGMEYDLRSSTDLLGDPAAWPVYDGNDGIAADPPKNTLPNQRAIRRLGTLFRGHRVGRPVVS